MASPTLCTLRAERKRHDNATVQIVPAIQWPGTGLFLSPPVAPETAMVPEPHRPPPGLEDALHVASLVLDREDGLVDALHLTIRKDDAP
jgi:hypothetical protein